LKRSLERRQTAASACPSEGIAGDRAIAQRFFLGGGPASGYVAQHGAGNARPAVMTFILLKIFRAM